MKTHKAFSLAKKIISSPTAFWRYGMHYLKLYRYNDLLQFANEEATDKGMPGHGYVRVYDAFLRSRRESISYLCEVGLVKRRLRKASLDEDHLIAPSLRMWRKYLPNTYIVGFDVRKFGDLGDPKCVTIQGDQSSRDDLQKIVDHHDGYEVIIDDALHASAHQQITFSYLFPHLTSGGIYCIEDLRSQPAEFERDDVPKTLEVLQRFAASGVWSSPLSTLEEKRTLEQQIKEIHFFESVGSANPREGANALAVIVKK